MKAITRALAFLSLVALSCFAPACGSSAKSSEPDAAVLGPDAAGPDLTVSSPDTKPAAPDAASGKTDAAVPDAIVAAPDTTSVTPDTAISDAIAAWPDASSAVPDAAASKTDGVVADAASDGISDSTSASPETATCAQETFKHLSPLELKTLLDGGEDPYLINVKGTSISSIPGTDAVLADDIPGIEALVKHDPCANIVIYCRSGGISQSVGTQLIAKGYRRVRDLAGGIIAWSAAGYPTL
jgi:rhodanese-related sulfurtransferase